jgi:hypothetical protein
MKALFAVVALTTLGQVAQATEPSTPPTTAPLVLNDTQMDQVTAGGPEAYFGGGIRTGNSLQKALEGAADPYPTINAGRLKGYGGQS